MSVSKTAPLSREDAKALFSGFQANQEKFFGSLGELRLDVGCPVEILPSDGRGAKVEISQPQGTPEFIIFQLGGTLDITQPTADVSKSDNSGSSSGSGPYHHFGTGNVIINKGGSPTNVFTIGNNTTIITSGRNTRVFNGTIKTYNANGYGVSNGPTGTNNGKGSRTFNNCHIEKYNSNNTIIPGDWHSVTEDSSGNLTLCGPGPVTTAEQPKINPPKLRIYLPAGSNCNLDLTMAGEAVVLSTVEFRHSKVVSSAKHPFWLETNSATIELSGSHAKEHYIGYCTIHGGKFKCKMRSSGKVEAKGTFDKVDITSHDGSTVTRGTCENTYRVIMITENGYTYPGKVDHYGTIPGQQRITPLGCPVTFHPEEEGASADDATSKATTNINENPDEDINEDIDKDTDTDEDIDEDSDEESDGGFIFVST